MIARIFQNFDDYPDFKNNQGVYINMRHTVLVNSYHQRGVKHYVLTN
jgi:hypothetical protein